MTIIGIPLTSKPKIGSWYFGIKIKEKDNHAVLSQIRHVDYRRMDKILCTIKSDDLIKIIKEAVKLIEGI